MHSATTWNAVVGVGDEGMRPSSEKDEPLYEDPKAEGSHNGGVSWISNGDILSSEKNILDKVKGLRPPETHLAE